LPYLLLIPVLLIGLLPGPALLGVWESLAFYHTFGAVEAPLSLLIVSRADIGGQGYALVEICRWLIQDLQLPLTLATYRIVPVALGALSLLLFFVVSRRYFGAWPAIGATALLAANQVFFQVQHMVSVLVVSGTALLFLIERLQALEVKYWDVKVWTGLGLAMALVAPHYGPGRIFAVALIGLWFARAYWLLREIPGSAAVQRGIWRLGAYSIIILLVLLALLDYRNPMFILRFLSFLFPATSDIAVLQYSTDIAGDGGFATTLKLNLRILFDSLFGQIGDYHSQYPSHFLADFRYPLIDAPVLVFVIPGLFLSLLQIGRRTLMFATPWGNILAMLAVFTLPLLLSLVMLRPEGTISTLSVHRMYFALIPLHLLVAALLNWVGNSSIKRVWKGALIFCLIAIGLTQVMNIVNEHSRFESQVYAAPWQRHGPEIRGYWDDHMPNRDRREYPALSHFQQHAQYANVARRIAAELQVRSNIAPHGSLRRIIFVDVSRFSETPTSPPSLTYIAGRNFHSIFLALYAGQAGANLNPVLMVDKSRTPIRPDLLSGLVYAGAPREYSGLMNLDESGLLTYAKGQNLVPVIVKVSGTAEYDILATTVEEESGARRLLTEANVPFEYVRLQ
jgi:hypothetical protein